MTASRRSDEMRARLVAATAEVQRLPYAWPGPPDAEAVRGAGRGTCAGKHALLREKLAAAAVPCRRLMVVGPLAPAVWPDLVAEAGALLEVHECLTIATDWAGPLLVDVTWHPAAIRAGLAGTLGWDARTDMRCAVEPVACYAVADSGFRAQKELLRSRLYTDGERAKRDAILTEIARRAAAFA